jgi:hypothetical protein
VKFILQGVENYKRVIYELKREQRLIELFLEKTIHFVYSCYILLSDRVISGVKNMWKEASYVSLQLSFRGMISPLYMTVFSNYIVSSLNCSLNDITNFASNYIQYFVIRGSLFYWPF